MDVGDLTSLRKLDLHRNQLASLPDTFSKLTNLKELDISENRFAVLPSCLVLLRHVRYFQMMFSFCENIKI